MCELEQLSVSWQAGNECTIYQVAELRNEIADLMVQKKPLILDLSEVEAFDVSFVQLLLATQLQADKDNIQLNVEGASEELTELINSIYCEPALAGLLVSDEGSGYVS